MGGGLMQLVAYGAQDVFLTGKPEISFFKLVYRRHTNFAIESVRQTLNGVIRPGHRVTSTINRNGDLVTHMYLEVDISYVSGSSYATENLQNSIGHALIEYVELEIGGQIIDKHYGEFFEILTELTLPEEKRQGFKEMIGRRDAYSAGSSSLESTKLFIPLQFFFCRNPGLALPLIALQYHEVKLNIKLRDYDDIFAPSIGPPSDPINNVKFDMTLWVDYVYLDTVERRRFAQMEHEYLIEQLQYTGPMDADEVSHKLNYNHPIKELIWVFRKNDAEIMNFNSSGSSAYINYGNLDADLDYADPVMSSIDTDWFSTMKLQLNGHDRFAERDVRYFRLVQPFQYHTRIPSKHIYVYSFALNPESHQPSGTCNFSRLDDVTMKLSFTSGQISNQTKGDSLLMYAINYNVLRIMSGMGGLAFSN